MGMNKRKICFFMEQFGLGGTDVMLVNLINNWPDGDDRIFYITNRGNKGIGLFNSLLKRKCETIIIDDKLSYCRLTRFALMPGMRGAVKKVLKVSLALLRYPLFIIGVLRFWAIMKKHSFDVIISNNGSYPGNDSCRAVMNSGWLCGIKKRYLIVCHKAGRSPFIFAPIEYLIDRTIQKCADKIIAISEATKKSLLEKRYFTDKVTVIYNGVEEVSIRNVGVRLREEYKIGPEKRIVGLVGNLEPHKGHEVLIDAVPAIRTRFPNVHFLFIGSLYDENWQRAHADKIINLIRSRSLGSEITVTGYLEGDPLGLIDQLDILVMPTIDFEGFGMVLAEAMIRGKPIVASRVGAIPEVVEDGVSGVLVPPCDPAALANAVVDIMNDESKRKAISEKARKRYEERFTGKMMAGNYFKLIGG